MVPHPAAGCEAEVLSEPLNSPEALTTSVCTPPTLSFWQLEGGLSSPLLGAGVLVTQLLKCCQVWGIPFRAWVRPCLLQISAPSPGGLSCSVLYSGRKAADYRQLRDFVFRFYSIKYLWPRGWFEILMVHSEDQKRLAVGGWLPFFFVTLPIVATDC